MIDDDTNKQLLRINDELMQLCKWLNERRDTATSFRLIPLVDDLTHILIEAGRTNCTKARNRTSHSLAEAFHGRYAQSRNCEPERILFLR
jgi:hypothetical protein